jgi:hypothetical protein
MTALDLVEDDEPLDFPTAMRVGSVCHAGNTLGIVPVRCPACQQTTWTRYLGPETVARCRCGTDYLMVEKRRKTDGDG